MSIIDNNFLGMNDIRKYADTGVISLPTVQRGFVWKPHQIENLWDSLLRGYPVGSFVLSPKNGNTEYELLDGQQRASAICLGFYNPIDDLDGLNDEKSLKGGPYFKTSTENIIVFIDLAKPNYEYDNRKYLFRVITKSHPWGYRRQENQKTLESRNIYEAMINYNIENYDYLKRPLNKFWPYDSYKPLPIGLFIEATLRQRTVEELEELIFNWKKSLNLSDVNDELQVINKRDAKTDYYSIQDILTAVKSMLDKCKIPILILDTDKIYGEDSKAIEMGIPENINYDGESHNAEEVENLTESNSEDRSVDEIENLFIRLNSGGTPLRGEELNYSVLKSHIDRDFQSRIENKCKGIFYPARFITIAFRLFNLYSSDQTSTDKDSTSMKIKPKQFQRAIKENKKDFVGFIKDTFLEENYIERVKSIISYNKDHNSIGLPKFIVNDLADKAPEIMFLLLYRLIIKKDRIDDYDKHLKTKVLGMLTLFAWLGKGGAQKDHSKLLSIVWPCARKFDTERFWSKETVQRAMTILPQFPKELKDLLPTGIKIQSLKSNSFLHKSDYGDFISKMFFNRDLILYIQREYLHNWFKDIDDYYLDDTNRAYDWDHISPYSAVYKKKKVNQALKDWYNSNGNLRAWPYSLNRKDHDLPPSEKLSVKFEDYNRLKAFTDSVDLDSLNDYLLKSSFCDKEWREITKDILEKIKESKNTKMLTINILERNRKMCQEWYEQLKINDFFNKKPSKNSINKFVKSFINLNSWHLDKFLIKNNDIYRFYTQINKDNDNNTKMFFDIPIENPLEEGKVLFGFENYLKEILPQSDNINIWENFVYGYFTLLSFSKESLSQLSIDFYNWLEKFPVKTFREEAKQKYLKSIKNEYSKIITN